MVRESSIEAIKRKTMKRTIVRVTNICYTYYVRHTKRCNNERSVNISTGSKDNFKAEVACNIEL